MTVSTMECFTALHCHNGLYSLFSLIDVVVSFVQAEYTVDEADGVTEFCIELCSGDPKRDFEFYVNVLNSSAISNALSLSLSL